VVNVLDRDDFWPKLETFIEQSRPEEDNKSSSESETDSDSESEFEGENLSENDKVSARLVLNGMERYIFSVENVWFLKLCITFRSK